MSDRLSRERDEAHRRFHEAFAALDRIVNETAGAAADGAGTHDLLPRLATFQSILVQFLQQLTPYVDTKLRVIEQAAADATMAATAAQRVAASAQRAAEASGPGSRVAGPGSMLQGPGSGVPGTRSAEQARLVTPDSRTQDPGPTSNDSGPRTPDSGPGAGPDDVAYVSFEDCFRGSEEEIRARQADYVPLFSGATGVDAEYAVLDVGCGRGEFLALLKEVGINARGIDVNEEMVAICRARGLAAERADAVDYLCELPEGALGGLFAAQVVEHLPPDRLMALLREAARVLRPGARIVLETINPTCWVAFFEAFIRDLTHVKPLHPDTLKFLAVASGFTGVQVQFRTPIREADRLRRLQPSRDDDPRLAELVEAFNLNMERLNDRLFTHLDYAVIGTRA